MKEYIKNLVWKILTLSLKSVNQNRNEKELKNKLIKIVPDLTNQYSGFKIDMNNKYQVNKIYNLHTFQINLVLKSLKYLNTSKLLNIIDIGDSSGTHILYLQNLFNDNAIKINPISVNLDQHAVERIQSKGLKAIHCRAEELHLKENISADLFLSFETIEHFFDPISFLHNMATKGSAEYFIITVPYVEYSRVGLHHIRNPKYKDKGLTAESTHVFELSPEDWDLIFKFSGWEIVYSDKYTQYPKTNPLYFTKYIWKKIDFNGFYGVILKRNLDIANKYGDW
jgi:SAM-dependent methyltransferase